MSEEKHIFERKHKKEIKDYKDIEKGATCISVMFSLVLSGEQKHFSEQFRIVDTFFKKLNHKI